MFDTVKKETIYTNRNLTKTFIKQIKICKTNSKHYMVCYTADSSLQLFSFPNPQFLDSIDSVQSFFIFEDGRVRTLYGNGVISFLRIKDGGQFEAVE